MNKQWNIISQDIPGLERNPGIKIPVKMTRDPGNPGSLDPGTEPLVSISVSFLVARRAAM